MMRNKLVLLMLISTISIAGLAQTTPAPTVQAADTLWRIKGDFGLNFNQVSLTNWAAGGQNSIAFTSTFGLDANYAKDKWKWDNLVRLGYGLSKQGEDPLNKTDDRILLNTNLGYELSGPWYVTLNANFRTQFADGYNLPNDSVTVSAFLAPGYLVAGIGIEYKPNKFFTAMINPIANKTTFVMDDFLSEQGAYGVDTLSNAKAEFGAFILLAFKKEIIKNVTLGTLYTMFAKYEDLAAWDVNWDLVIGFKINSFLAANITTNLIYDQDINIPVDRTGDGVKESFGPRVQFRQALGIGLTANFAAFK
jgi:hypothetical protein